MNRLTGSDGAPALAILGPGATRLVRELDGVFAGWGSRTAPRRSAPRRSSR